MKVRTNGIYTYTKENSLWEVTDAKHDLTTGERVRVVKCNGCPPPNTMGHAHVERLDGRFVGLVHTAALSK